MSQCGILQCEPASWDFAQKIIAHGGDKNRFLPLTKKCENANQDFVIYVARSPCCQYDKKYF